MSSMKSTNSKFDSVASIVDYLREPSPTEVVSITTTSSVINSTRINNQFKITNKKQKKEKESANLMNNIPTIEKLPSGRVRYGPVTINPRKQPSKTLFTGRRSKYEILDGEEEEKRRMRRDRNRIAATKCREKREKILIELEVVCSNEENQYTSLQNKIQQLKQQKEYLESYISNHFLNCPLQQQQQQQSSMVFGDTSFLSTIEETPAPPLPPQQFQLIANNEEEFTAFLRPTPVLTNSVYNSDQSNYLFNSQPQQQQQQQQQQQSQTITMTSSSLERIINNLHSPTSYTDNNNNNCSGLFNSAYGSSSCAQQHSSSSEDDSLPPTLKNPFVC